MANGQSPTGLIYVISPTEQLANNMHGSQAHNYLLVTHPTIDDAMRGAKGNAQVRAVVYHSNGMKGQDRPINQMFASPVIIYNGWTSPGQLFKTAKKKANKYTT